MAIQIVCPGCHKRFKVSDKFAGKKGPCPNCKTEIQIPRADQQVVIHEPDEFVSGGKSVAGRPDIRPIARRETKVKPIVVVGVGAGVLGVFIVALLLGRAGTFQGNMLLTAIGLLLISPPIAAAGYTFLQSDEDLQPYRGKMLYIRAAICGTIYAALWGGFIYVAGIFMTGDLWEWIVLAPFFVGGAVVALACLDLDFTGGFFHFTFYAFLTILLRWAVGFDWIWNLPKNLIP